VKGRRRRQAVKGRELLDARGSQLTAAASRARASSWREGVPDKTRGRQPLTAEVQS
jgi:hypothetical protein